MPSVDRALSRVRTRAPFTLITAVIMLATAGIALVPESAAKAPPLATTVLAVNAYSAPTYDAAVVVVLPEDAEVELTGNAAPGFLGVIYDGEEVFVPARLLSLGTRPGIDTAVTTENTPLLEAPMQDGSIRLTIPDGETVILTGATVDGYDAASYDGTGGWIYGRGLAR